MNNSQHLNSQEFRYQNKKKTLPKTRLESNKYASYVELDPSAEHSGFFSNMGNTSQVQLSDEGASSQEKEQG